MTDATFEDVLSAARTGHRWALAHLYNQFQTRMLRYIQSRISADAEDVAHEVWLDVAGGLSRFTGDESAFTAWLFTIARRRIVDLQRRAGRRRTVTLPTEELPERISEQDVEQIVLGAIAGEEVLAKVRALPGDQADVVLLRVVAGLEVEEVARVLGKTPGNVRVIAHRALRRLARVLELELGAAEDVTMEQAGRFQGRDAS